MAKKDKGGNGQRPAPKKMFRCSACGMEFPTIHDLEVHISVNHK